MAEEKNIQNENETVEKEEQKCECENAQNGACESEKNAKKEKKSSKKEIDALKKELEEEKKKSNELDYNFGELTEMHLRTVAEYENYRKRATKEKEEAYSEAYVNAVKELLPILDNLERAVQFAESGNLAEGVNMTLNMFKDTFAKMGVEVIETDNKEFDPNLHNAVMHIEDESYGENIIAETFSKGYKLGDKIIRYAMVKVAN